MDRRLCALFIGMPLVLAAQMEISKTSQNALDGNWKFVFDSSPTTNLVLPNKTFSLKWTGKDVMLRDPATEMIFTAKPERSPTAKPSTRFSIGLPIGNYSGNLLTSPDAKDTATIDAYIEGDKLTGIFKLNNSAVSFKAIKLVSAWECSGHPQHKPDEPAYHVASDADEMKVYSSKYGCHGWHKL